MPPAAKKDIVLIIFDIKSRKKEYLLKGLLKMATHKMISKKDLWQMLIVNTQETSNAKQIRNVAHTDINIKNPKTIFDSITNANVTEGECFSNFLDVLLLGIYYMKQAIGMSGAVNYQIVYFTTLEEDQQQQQHNKCDNEKVTKIIRKLNEYNIHLYIFGPDITLPFPITKPEDVNECMQKGELDTHTTNHSAKSALLKIVQSTKRSVMCDLKVGTNIFHFFRQSHGSQPWLPPLTIGNSLNVSSKTMKIFRKDTNVKLAKENVAGKFGGRTFLLEEDESIELDWNDLIKGVIRHGKFVKIDAEDMFKSESERSFDLVAFTKSKFLPEAYVEGDCTFHVLPGGQPGNGHYELFESLVNVLAADDKYAIVQRIYNKNNNPKFFVLKAEPHEKPPRFVMTSLPYADDIVAGNYFNCKQPNKDDVEEVEENDFTKFCKSIDLYSDSCAQTFPLAPSMTMDLFSDNIVKETIRKLCGQDFQFTDIGAFDFDTLNQNEHWENIKELWPEAD